MARLTPLAHEENVADSIIFSCLFSLIFVHLLKDSEYTTDLKPHPWVYQCRVAAQDRQ